jgi:hypothetical protein
MNYQIQGLSIHAEVHGTAEPALLFLHYWGGTSRTWRKVTAELEGQWLAWLNRRARTPTLSRRRLLGNRIFAGRNLKTLSPACSHRYWPNARGHFHSSCTR